MYASAVAAFGKARFFPFALTDKGKVFASKLLNTVEPEQPVNMADLEK